MTPSQSANVTPLPAGLAFRDVTRRFGAVEAVKQVSLDIARGKITAILGASGSGKSTLLRLAAGLERIDAGAILFDGVVMSSRERHVPPEDRRIGLVFQDFALFPHLNVEANVAFGLEAQPRPQRRAMAMAWLERVGLAHRAAAFPHELSGGEQQRVSLARALAPQPRAILLDEPFSGLDPTLRAELRDRSMALVRETGATALFVTHDADDAMLAADAITILHAGNLIQMGAPRALYQQPTSLVAARALGPLNEWRGEASNGVCATPWGPMQAAEDGSIIVATRPEYVGLKHGGAIRITERRPIGAVDRLSLALPDAVWTAYCAPSETFSPGDGVELQIEPANLLVFGVSV